MTTQGREHPNCRFTHPRIRAKNVDAEHAAVAVKRERSEHIRTARLVLAATIALAFLSVAYAVPGGGLLKQCAGYRYQRLDGAKPFLLLYSDGTPPAWLIDHADRIAKMGFDGILIAGIMSNQTSDVWAGDGDATTKGEDDVTFQTARRANMACRRAGVKQNFLLVAFTGELPDWWDNAAWQKIHGNFRQAARFARAAGFAGICIDSEYVGQQYQYLWPGYTYDHYTVADLRRMARLRMSQMAAAMYDEFPQMVLFLVHGVDSPIPNAMFAGWVEEAARRDARGGAHLATATYDACNVPLILAEAVHRFRVIEQVLIPEARAYWRKRCGLSPGGWPLQVDQDFDRNAFKRARLSPEQFRAAMAGFNMASAKYAWIFPAGPSWWQAREAEVKQYHLSTWAALPPVPNVESYYRIARSAEQVDDATMKRASRALRTMTISNPEALMASLGLRAARMIGYISPSNQVWRGLIPADYHGIDWSSRQADRMAANEEMGLRPDVTGLFGLVHDFSVIGPFSNERWLGHDRAYPPEHKIDLNATCDGMAGPVRWQQVTIPDGQGHLDFTQIMKPKDWTVAYSLCYVHSKTRQQAQIRTGTNDAIKLWLNGRLLLDYHTAEGRWAILDDDITPVTLPAGWSTILVKVAQTAGNWGMYLRITDLRGAPLPGITTAARRPSVAVK